MNQVVQDRIAHEQNILQEAGYTNVENLGINKNKKREWSFTHIECGKSSTMVFGNIQAGLKKDPVNVPCSYCGAKRRMNKLNTK